MAEGSKSSLLISQRNNTVKLTTQAAQAFAIATAPVVSSPIEAVELHVAGDPVAGTVPCNLPLSVESLEHATSLEVILENGNKCYVGQNQLSAWCAALPGWRTMNEHEQAVAAIAFIRSLAGQVATVKRPQMFITRLRHDVSKPTVAAPSPTKAKKRPSAALPQA